MLAAMTVSTLARLLYLFLCLTSIQFISLHTRALMKCNDCFMALLLLLVGRQEERPACKKWWDG